jgi:hypothetical protein
MDIVTNDEEIVVSRVGALKAVGEDVLCILDLFWFLIVVVISIQVEVGDDIAHIGHILLARISNASRIRRAHISGEFAQNVGEGHLVPDHLVITLSRAD